MPMMSTKPFSELKISSDSIEFEEEQLNIYTSLVASNPGNKRLIWARDLLSQQITIHKKELDNYKKKKV